MTRQHLIDFVVANHYTSTHPRSRPWGRSGDAAVRYTLRDRSFEGCGRSRGCGVSWRTRGADDGAMQAEADYAAAGPGFAKEHAEAVAWRISLDVP